MERFSHEWYQIEAKYMLDQYAWNPVEEELVRNHFEDICEKFFAMDDEVEEKLCEAFDGWLDKTCKKSKLNYWMKKTNTTVEEINIYLTW